MNKIDYLLERKIKTKIDGSALRIIAIITMFVDHFAFMIIGNGILYGYRPDIQAAALNTDAGRKWYVLYVICRSIGRISFPIFCFLLVEGFIHTKNLFKYFVRLFLLAFISEIPYNLMCGNSILYFEKQNTIFTLLLSLFMLFFVKKSDVMKNEQVRNVVIFALVIIACVISHLLHLDYKVSGIILVFCIYFFRNDKNIQMLLIAIISFIISFVSRDSFRYYGVGILATPLLFLYSGKVGFLHKYMWWYYLLYPLHLLLFYGVVFFTYIKI